MIIVVFGGFLFRFKLLVDFYKYFYYELGYNFDDMEIGIVIYGFIIDKDLNDFVECYFLLYYVIFIKLGEE